MAEAIRVNFSTPMPLFPLRDTVLLPHAVLPLHIFEQRYRQMVSHVLEDTKQFALATISDGRSAEESANPPRLRPIACVGQIIEHQGLPDGRHNILLHGICRAKILDIEEPTDERLYRTADLAPIEIQTEQPPALTDVREQLKSLLLRPTLKRMRSVDTVIEWFDRSDIPTPALLELVGFTLIKDSETKYRLLAEPDPKRRAAVIQRELVEIDNLVSRAQRQGHEHWPKGMSWN